MKITPSQNGLLLEDAHGETISLSSQDVAELVRDAHQLIGQQSRFLPVATMEIEDVILSLDAHHTQIVLRLIGANNVEIAYAIPGQTARKLLDGLDRKVQQIEAAQANRIKQ